MTPRSVTLERLVYGLAAPALATVPNAFPHSTANTGVIVGGVVAGTAGLVGAVTAWKSGEGIGRKLMRLSPALTGAVLDLATQVTSTTQQGDLLDIALATGWAGTYIPLAPFTRTSRRLQPALAPVPQPPQLTAAPQQPTANRPAQTVQAPEEAVDDGGPADAYTLQVRKLWNRRGAPGQTIVIKADPHPNRRRDLTMLVRAAEQGRPINGLKEDDIAAVFGVDTPDVHISEVPRQTNRQGGPAWRWVAVIPDETERRRKAPTASEKWADTVGRDRGGAPGSELVAQQRDDQRGVTFWRARMKDPTELPRIDLAKICRALGVRFDDACVFALIDDAEFLISVFDEPPLSRVFPATRELLTPDAKGMFVCGYAVTGQPVKNMVYQHDKNAPCHGLILGVSRSGKTQYFAVSMIAHALAGGVSWLSSVRRDEKTSILGQYIDRQGYGPLYMVRKLRAAKALCEIRAEMPWDYDGRPHDYKPGDPRCPYRGLNVYADEFMTATADETYGEEIKQLGDDLTVTGLKYGVGFYPAGQSPFAHSAFSTEMKDNLRQNSRPLIFNMGSPAATRKAAEGTMENSREAPTIPARYSRQEGSVIDRAMAGEAAPENGISTGGVAVIVLDSGKAVLMRCLYVDFDTDLADLFPDEIHGLTDHEITELEKRDLWGDWNRPDEDLEDEDAEDDTASGAGRRRSRGPSRSEPVITPQQALTTIKNLTRT